METPWGRRSVGRWGQTVPEEEEEEGLKLRVAHQYLDQVAWIKSLIGYCNKLHIVSFYIQKKIHKYKRIDTVTNSLLWHFCHSPTASQYLIVTLTLSESCWRQCCLETIQGLREGQRGCWNGRHRCDALLPQIKQNVPRKMWKLIRYEIDLKTALGKWFQVKRPHRNLSDCRRSRWLCALLMDNWCGSF